MSSTSPALASMENPPVDTPPRTDLVEPVPSALAGDMNPGEMLSSHGIEREVMHRLQNHPGLKFVRLNVHRCNRDQICLEGFLESNDQDIDLCEVVRGIHGITTVVNHVVTSKPNAEVPKKG